MWWGLDRIMWFGVGCAMFKLQSRTLLKSIKAGRAQVKSVTRAAGVGVDYLVTRITDLFRARQERLTTIDVLCREYNAIWDENRKFATEQAYRRAVKGKGQAALCLSGGGIRSSAFSLGVLQALAQKRLLSKFQYLSTVSGGGYIGAWLSRWINEQDHKALAVEKALGDRPNAPPPEIPQISALRRNSNYLTPQVGITSADTWTGIMLWVRNVMLNWLVFLPALLIAVAIPNMYLAVMAAFYQRNSIEIEFICDVTLLFAFLALLSATWQASRFLPSHRNKTLLDSTNVKLRIVSPALIWAALVPIILVQARYPILGTFANLRILGQTYSVLCWIFWVNFSAVVGGYILAGFTAHRDDYWLFIRNFPVWLVICFIASWALLFAIYVIGLIASVLPPSNELFSQFAALQDGDAAPLVVMLCVLGPLGVTLAHLLLTALYVGFRHTLFQDDADREWLGRLSAVNVFPTLLWALFAAICILLAWLFFEPHQGLWIWLDHSKKWLAGVISVISGLIAVLGGKSATSKLDFLATVQERKPSLDTIVKVATSIFLVALFMCLARAERIMADLVYVLMTAPPGNILCLDCLAQYMKLALSALPPVEEARSAVAPDSSLVSEILKYFSTVAGRYVLAHIIVVCCLGLLVWIASKKIDVNRFSLHGVYRNRLVRAFLGAARRSTDPKIWTRNPDPFTGFDPEDNVRMHELKAEVGKRRVLLPLVNVTLNLVSGENLEWQERKASAFIITPFACGGATLDRRPKRPAQYVPNAEDFAPDLPNQRQGAYTLSEFYGGSERDLRMRPDGKRQQAKTTGISLGTAMTISGAAVSPSQGYHSSAATAFLMTLFNVRLGAWMVNPAVADQSDRKKSGPTDALSPLFVEALGMTNDRSNNVYLSDGGHFDNLGIYEMIRRRCRYIFVVDADADKDFAFEDLGKAVRQVVIDLEADVDFESIAMQPPNKSKKNSPTYAVARIRYRNPADIGLLIYVKPTYFFETAPVDVRSYGTVNKEFPHETTLDQWFGESQFESYRRLGYFLASHLDRRRGVRNKQYKSMASFFTRVDKMKPTMRKARSP
jgi:hypothetical protein